MSNSNSIHIVAGGKGGCGKSPTAVGIGTWLTQQNPGAKIYSVDTENPTVCTFASLNTVDVTPIRIGSDGQRVFDGSLLIPAVTDWEKSEGAPVVIDVGTSAFTGFTGWAVETDLLGILQDADKDVVLHLVLVGGQEFSNAIVSADEFANKAFPKAKVVIWKNEWFAGSVADPASGKAIEDTKFFKALGDRVLGVIAQPKDEKSKTDVYEQAWSKGVTALDAQKDPEWDSVRKRILSRYYSQVFEGPLSRIDW